ncbi:MAG: hypothetical protein CVV27_07195 [Candidatus Melainabacteria bacterium HGW-Melainabacteria-1]|nr:MAG: hypothetical protein CVV27_07195 [Candidatus Melainabacteria bacterium HGW-Melainabacteria-1]
MKQISQKTLKDLCQQLQSGDLKARCDAAEALGEYGLPEAVPALLTALGDPSPKLRKKACEALGLIGSEAALPGLRQALADPETVVAKKPLKPWA